MQNEMEKTLEQFLKYEAEQKLFERLNINGIKYWHYIRFMVYMLILETKFDQVNNNMYQKRIEIDDKSMWNQIDRYIIKNPLLVKQKDILVFNHSRRVKQNGCYKCVYTDEWINECKQSYYVFEEPFNGTHLKPVKTKNLKYFDIFEYGKFTFVKRTKSEKINVMQHAKVLIQSLENEFNIQFTNQQRKKLVNQLIMQMSNRECYKKYFRHLLKKIKPKIIILVVAYNFDHMLLIETAKEFGIPVVELEHGIIGKGHIAYNFYEQMNLISFPDYIFTFGQFDVDTPQYPFDRKFVFPVGSAELEKQSKFYKTKVKKKKRKKIITYLSDNTKELLCNSVELSKMINTNNYDIIVKLHPSEYVQWKKWYPFLINNNIRVVNDAKHDIYYYLAISDYVVGCASTTLYEATAFDTQILIYKVGEYYRSEPLVENKLAEYVDSVEEIYQRITSNNKIQYDINKEYFFSNNSKNLIFDAIHSILQERSR